MQAPHASAGGGPYDTSYSYDPRMACLGIGLRTEIGVSTQASSAGIACERAPVSVRDVRKRAHDLSKRLDTAAQKAADDQEANLSILAFSARSDTKDHPNNTPHLFASPSIVKAFHKRGVSDIKSYLTDMAYETGNDEEIPTPQLVATLKQQVSSLTERVSDLSRLEHENAVLKEEIELLRRVAEGHAVVAAKLQEAMSISNDYSFYAGQPSTSGQH
ncbi:hypothetical protein EUX98_g2935 [Antrodiella citrinella]|uniref:Uncharacterized protein n=1 Tax=Antrodiella citrinella TaxID=2447956 RepID=A0A4S4MXU4_9APHY|nr:hypothetical protein EUX98_g2935 [Antrodiella citrinella]